MSARQIRPKLETQTCAVCERTLLQGEHFEMFVAPGGERRAVCELCVPRATRARWVREQDAGAVTTPRPVGRTATGGWRSSLGSILHRKPASRGSSGRAGSRSRNQRAREADQTPIDDQLSGVPLAPELNYSNTQGDESGDRSGRDFLAVPSDVGARLVRGADLFNQSQFPRTISGLSRSLGKPQAAVLPEGPTHVVVTVAWDITWYSYRIDLNDPVEPVELAGRGNDMIEVSDRIASWNAVCDDDGHIAVSDVAIVENPDTNSQS